MIEPRRTVQAALERGALRDPFSRTLASVWERIADPVRRVKLPSARVIGVGGATLGGSGKTPVTAALALALAGDCAIVTRGYRSNVRQCRQVRPGDRAADVGDEAVWLASFGVPVVAGRDRDAALALAARLAPVIVVDGLLQAKPARLALSILVVDGSEPWGSDACPPSGDRRARHDALLAAADVVLALDRPGAPRADWQTPRLLRAESVLRGATTPNGDFLSIDALGNRSLGVALAVGRPERVLDALRHHGIAPRSIRLAADHGIPAPSRRRARVEAWLTTAKCATKLGPKFEGAPVWTLAHEVHLPEALVAVASGQKMVVESAPCRPRDS